MHSEFMAFIADEASTETVRHWAERQGFPAATVQTGGPDVFMALLENEEPPRFAFVDIDNQIQPAQIVARLTSLCGSNTKLVIVGTANDISLYRSLVAAGAADYLVKPLSHESLTHALAAATSGSNGKGEESRIIIMIGARGGVGVSTLATNLGWILAHERKENTALFDLDLQFGTSALALDLEPGRGLRDIVASPQRVDSLMVASAMVSESDHFSILGAEEAVDEPLLVDSGAVTALLKELRANFRTIIIDMPRHVLASQKRLLALAQDIVLVSDLTLAGIRDTLRLRVAIKTLGASARIVTVAARVGPQHPAAVDPAAFSKGVQAKIDVTIPEDYKTVAAASNAGKMLGITAPSAPITKAVRELASCLDGGGEGAAMEKTKGGSGILGWLGGGKADAKDGSAKAKDKDKS